MTEGIEPGKTVPSSTQEGVTASPADGPEGLDHAHAVALVLAAFDKARASGKVDWHRMTTAVLKNRLLDATSGEFSEAKWGAASFRHFLSQLSDVVRLDPSSQPAMVELLGGPLGAKAPLPATGASEATADSRNWRVRSDLWHAVLDYSSGIAYDWDGDHAIPRSGHEVVPDQRRLPTLSEQEFVEWQREFLERADLSEEVTSLGTGPPIPSRKLPFPARQEWNGEIKRRVRHRLSEWFEQQGLAAPHDMIETTRGTAEESAAGTEQLRRAIVRAVEQMNRAELEGIDVPATILLRLKP